MTVHKAFYFRQFFLIAIVLLSTLACREAKRCDPPSEVFGNLTFRQLWYNGPRFGFCDYSDTFLNRLDANDIAREKDDKDAQGNLIGPAKWIVQVSVGGTCSNNDPWTKIYKKGEFTVTHSGNTLIFTIPNIPKSFNNDFIFIPRILSP